MVTFCNSQGSKAQASLTSMTTSILAYEGVSCLPIQGAFQSSVSVNNLEGRLWDSIRPHSMGRLVNNIRWVVFRSVGEGFRHVFESDFNDYANNNNKICVPFSTTGQWLYAFDLSSIRLCSYAPKHATINGLVRSENAAHSFIWLLRSRLIYAQERS